MQTCTALPLALAVVFWNRPLWFGITGVRLGSGVFLNLIALAFSYAFRKLLAAWTTTASPSSQTTAISVGAFRGSGGSAIARGLSRAPTDNAP
jgi:hypothetical protein